MPNTSKTCNCQSLSLFTGEPKAHTASQIESRIRELLNKPHLIPTERAEEDELLVAYLDRDTPTTSERN